MLRLVELSLSCKCANTTDSASFLIPPVASMPIEESHLEGSSKEQLYDEIEADFGKLASKSWRCDNMEIDVPVGNQRFASFNANGQLSLC